MPDDLLRALFGFFAIIDPIGNILVFEAVAGRANARRRTLIAALAVATAFVLIALFALGGERFLDLMGISSESFQIAAGVLLILPAIRLVEQGELFDGSVPATAPALDAAIVPLALPMLSGPGALALSASLSDQFGAGLTIFAAACILALSFVVFAAAGVVVRIAHPAVLRAAARIIGVLLMAIAVDFIVSGWVAATA